MKIEYQEATVLKLTELESLDPVSVILRDYGNGRGQIIIECFGDCWAAYWGAMGCSLRKFVCQCDVEYLERNLIGRMHKMSKDQREYLKCIIRAVQEGLKL